MHLCVNKLTIIGSDDGLWPDRRQAGILLIGPLIRNPSEIIKKNTKNFIEENAFENVSYKMAVILSRSQCVNHYLQSHHETEASVSIGDKACLRES